MLRVHNSIVVILVAGLDFPHAANDRVDAFACFSALVDQVPPPPWKTLIA